MSVNWECGPCSAYQTAKEFDEDSTEWREFCVLRDALIWALLVTGFPPKSAWKITPENWEEIFHRLFIVEKIGGPYRTGPKGKAVKFTPEEVHSMIGLSVNAGNKSETEFYKWVKTNLRERSKVHLSNFNPEVKVA